MKKLKTHELNRISVEDFKNSTKWPLILVLDNLRSLNNVGSIFRTADAFRIEKLLLCGITATPPHREIQKTALGATDSVVWEYSHTTREALLKLKKENYQVVAIEQMDNRIFLSDFEWKNMQKTTLVFGNEINGISSEILDLIDVCVEIPQFGTKHSFNVSVSAGIVLWHLFYTSL